MKTTQNPAGLCVLAFAALAAASPSPAQEAAAAAPAPAAEIRYDVLSSRTVPDGGRDIILQRVSPPLLPAPPAPVLRPPLTPEQLAARAAAQAARPAPMRSRLRCLNVTAFAEGFTYIEWWPDHGGAPFAAWSSADFRYMSLVPDFEIVSDNTRYTIFPFGIYTYQPRPGRPPLASGPSPVTISADGPGFVLVKGNAADKDSINPIAALHQIYKEEAPQLKLAWEERERIRQEEEAWRAVNPPPPPGDVVIRMWPIKSQRYSTQPASPSAAPNAGNSAPSNQ